MRVSDTAGADDNGYDLTRDNEASGDNEAVVWTARTCIISCSNTTTLYERCIESVLAIREGPSFGYPSLSRGTLTDWLISYRTLQWILPPSALLSCGRLSSSSVDLSKPSRLLPTTEYHIRSKRLKCIPRVLSEPLSQPDSASSIELLILRRESFPYAYGSSKSYRKCNRSEQCRRMTFAETSSEWSVIFPTRRTVKDCSMKPCTAVESSYEHRRRL